METILKYLLDYLDKPWKVVAVIGLFIVGGLGWALYQSREAIIESWLTPSALALKVNDVPDALDKLIGETDADLVQIWAVDLAQNAQWFVAARGKGGTRPVIPAPRRLPVIVSTSDATTLVNVLNGYPICVDVSDTGSPLARRLAGRGMTRGCAIPIPPTSDAFIGVIYLAWQVATEKSVEDVAAGAAREIAFKLTNR